MASLFCTLRTTRTFFSNYVVHSQSSPLRNPILRTSILRRCLTTETRATITSLLKQAPVVLFMKGTPSTPQCGFSRASIQILGLQGVDPDKFAAVNVLEDEEIRQGIKEFSDWPTIPQLYVNEEFVGGCDILMNQHQSGELAEYLEKEGVLVPENKVGGFTKKEEVGKKED